MKSTQNLKTTAYRITRSLNNIIGELNGETKELEEHLQNYWEYLNKVCNVTHNPELFLAAYNKAQEVFIEPVNLNAVLKLNSATALFLTKLHLNQFPIHELGLIKAYIEVLATAESLNLYNIFKSN